MKKKALLIKGVLLTLSLFLLTGCHGSKEKNTFEVPDSFDTSKNYELTFWAKNDTNKVQTAIYERAVEEFQELYPNVTVTIRLYNDYSKIYNDVITNISTDTTPNICITYPDHIATYLEGDNTVVPLDDLFTDEKFGFNGSEVKFDAPEYSEMIQKYLEECKVNGSYYAVPFMRSTEALYINKNLVNALGYEIPDEITWDFIWEVSEKAMEKNDDGTFKVNNQTVMIPFIYKSTDNFMIQSLKQLDAGYSDAAGNILIFNDTTKEILLEIAKHAETGAFSTFKISSYPGNFLNANQCIFAIDSTAGATWMGSAAPLHDISKENIADFETVVRPIPQYDWDNPKMISQGPSICIFNKEDSGEVIASWLFTQYLLTNSIQIPYAETEGYVPVTAKAQDADEYTDYLARGGEDTTTHYQVKVDATKMLLDNIDNTFITPVFNGSASLRDAAGQMIEEVTKARRRKQEVSSETIDALYDNMKSLYHLDSLSTDKTAGNDLGELPTASKALLITLISVWCLIIAYFVKSKIKTKK